jgi:phosphofructokinase-like protein
MRVGLLTGGGDCPGLNAAIRAVVQYAHLKPGFEVVGVYNSFNGLFREPLNTKPLTLEDVSEILARGGTILGTHNKGNPLGDNPKQTVIKIKQTMQSLGLDGLIVIGGEGTQSTAHELSQEGINILGIPKTIDNDLPGSEQTIGFASCIDFVADSVLRLRSTAESHDRIMVIEVMGRDSGYIALHGGIAGGANVILIPEIEFSMAAVAKKIQTRHSTGRKFSVVVISEGARALGEQSIYIDKKAANQRLGGIGAFVADTLAEMTHIETRVTVLGHLQRGGAPSAADRILATQLAVHACQLAEKRNFGHYVVFQAGQVQDLPYKKLVPYSRRKLSVHDPMVQTAESLGICLGR